MVALECIMVDGVFGENCDILDVVVMDVMVMIIISTCSAGQTGKPGQTGQTDLTFKLDFPGNLCRASFANVVLFYTGYGMDYSLNQGRERAAHKLIICRHNRS